MLPVTLNSTNLPQTQFSPEIEFLLCCVRARLNPNYTEKVRALAQPPLDWTQLVETAREHALLPLLYWQLKNICPELVPSAILQELQTEFSANAAKNMAMTATLLKIVALFKANDIPIMAFKGPVLAQQAYGNLALREFFDLDLLVPRSAVMQAQAILIGQGYQPAFDVRDEDAPAYAKVKTRAQEEFFVKTRYEQAFFLPQKQSPVDLHWRLFAKHLSFSPSEEILWQHRHQVQLGNACVQSLTTEMLLIYLCCHAAKHNWNSLSCLCDIAELIHKQPGIDWNEVIVHGLKPGTRRMVLLGLYLAHRLLELPLPSTVLQQAETEPSLPALGIQIQNNLFQPQKPELLTLENEQGRASNSIFSWFGALATYYKNRFASRNKANAIFSSCLELRRDKFWYWFDRLMLPTPYEWMKISLPQPLFFLYYPIRFIHLLFNYLTGKHL